MKKLFFLLVISIGLADTNTSGSAPGYKNFKVAVYARAYEVRQMNDLKWLEPIWTEITDQVNVDKIYLETHRDLIIVDEKTILTAKKFFNSRGITTSGGITLTVNEGNRFETFCYSNPEHRQKVKEIVEFTARHFDEIILDDFFFTDCKCALCIKAKGNRSWTQFRLEQLTEAAQSLVIGPAKAVNPKVKVVIKYPNWYEHFQGLGFNPETEPGMFDALYTGTETRDPDAPDLLKALQGEGIEDIVELEYTGRKALVTDFSTGWRGGALKADKQILIPQIQYLTNDSWEDITASGTAIGWPVLHQARYGRASIFIITIPDSFGGLYHFPAGVLNRMREVLTADLNPRIEAPAKISLFVYDNNTFILQSFLPEETQVKIIAETATGKLTDILSGEQIESSGKSAGFVWGRERTDKTNFAVTLKPHSFRVFKTD